jgi:hypothetical protein
MPFGRIEIFFTKQRIDGAARGAALVCRLLR